MPDLTHRRLRAPQEDGAALIAPPLSEAPALVDANRASAAEWDRLSGVPFSDWRTSARTDLVQFSRADADAISVEVAAALAERPIILSGHQPELFHPGVWFKNFLLDAIARRVDGTGINLVIDNDVVRSTSIRLPTGAADAPRIVEVHFDAAKVPMPWEERKLEDLDLFSTFPRRVREAFGVRLADSELVLDRLWPHAMNQVQQVIHLEERGLANRSRDLMLDDTLVTARHRLERELGLETWEYELNLLNWSVVYKAFAAHIFSRAAEFHSLYNAALAEYRAINHVRSHSHPVPDLAQDAEWLEMPFWMWTTSQPVRQRVFVRPIRGSWELSDGGRLRISPIASGWRRTKGVFPWDDVPLKLAHKLRPRALITTMFARLVLSDLFIHGIGGAKYDELTDLIIRRFFGIEPPKYMTATATFRLPIERPQVTADDVRDAGRKIRDVRYHPESLLRDRLVTNDASLHEPLSALAAEKREYLAQHDLRRCEQEVFHRLDILNRAMHRLLRPVEEQLRAKHNELVRQLKQSQMLGSREFSFVLFPAEKLSARLLDLCKSSP